MPLLEVENLRTHFRAPDGSVIRAVENVTFAIDEGETLAIVGESGSGKSVTSLSIMRLLPDRTSRSAGAIRFRGVDLLGLSETEMRAIRGNEMAMIFQEPMSSLNPVLTIGHQIAETFILHRKLGRAEAKAKAVEMLRLVDIPAADRRIDEYPHQLSGGMRQRVMIAMALACSPKLLIADEPTTALDVTIQAQVLDLIVGIQSRTGTAIILITHDLGVVAEVADRVIVMYAGRTVEEAPTATLFTAPRHPYTRGLLGTVPRLGSSLSEDMPQRLAEIPGQVPSLRQQIVGCPFAGRCPSAMDRCRVEAPRLRASGPRHAVACHLADGPQS